MTKQHYESYKETGNPWLGKVPSEWQVRRADFVIKSRKLQISPSELENRDVYHFAIPTVQATGAGAVEEGESIDSGKLIINEPQVLVSKLNPRKATVAVAEPHPDYLTVASTEFVPLIPWEADLNYMFYVWKSQKVTDRLASFVQSVTRSHQRCDPAEITKIPWAWPSQDQQQKIAAFLDRKTAEIDTLIAKKHRLLDRLAEKRTALITRAVTKGLNPDAPMKDSGIEWLGEIPAHWDVARLKNITQLESGHTPSKSKPEFWVDCDIPWVSLRDTKLLADNDYISQTHTYINKAGLAGSSARLLPAGTVIFTRDATVGLVSITEVEMAVSQHLIAWIPSEKIDKDYLLFVFEAMRDYLHSLEFGSTVRTIGMDDIRRLVGPVPPVREQLEVVDFVLAERDRLKNLEARVNEAIEKLQEYRSALITNAVTGQIKVD